MAALEEAFSRADPEFAAETLGISVRRLRSLLCASDCDPRHMSVAMLACAWRFEVSPRTDADEAEFLPHVGLLNADCQMLLNHLLAEIEASAEVRSEADRLLWLISLVRRAVPLGDQDRGRLRDFLKASKSSEVIPPTIQ